MKITIFLIIIFLIISSVLNSEEINENIRIEESVVKAVIFACGLERQLYEMNENINTKDQVYQHYLQGYSEDIAFRYANHSWTEYGLKLGDYAAFPPDVVFVQSVSDERAVAYFETPIVLQDEESWKALKYTIVELVRKENKWVITKTERTNNNPSNN